MRKIGTMAGIIFAGLCLWGCGEDHADNSEAVDMVSATVIEVLKDGSLAETITEDFAEDYYSEEELKNTILAEVSEFNASAEEGNISVDKFESQEGVVTVTYKYPSTDIYTQFNFNKYNNKELFCGTIAEAYEAGYSLDVSLKSVKNEEETIGKEELLEMGDYHVLIAGEPMRVKIFSRIMYIGENVAAAGKNQANMNADENGEALGKYYLVFK